MDLIASLAAGWVPTNKIIPPFSTVSFKNFSAFSKALRVKERSINWTPLRTVCTNEAIFGLLFDLIRPYKTPALAISSKTGLTGVLSVFSIVLVIASGITEKIIAK